MPNIEQTMSYLKGVEKMISAFDGLELTMENRKNLYKTIQKLTDSDFLRNDSGKVVELFWGEETYSHGMRADITIGVNNNKIFVDTWILWKTIVSYNEMLEERKAHGEH